MKVLVCASFPESLVLFRGPLLSEFVRLKHEVTACAPGANREVELALGSVGVRYLACQLDRTTLNPWSDLKYALTLFRLFQKECPDLVLSYTVKPVIYGSIAAFYAGVPRIFSIITGLGYSFTDYSLRRRLTASVLALLYRWALARNEIVYFQNQDDLALFRKLHILRASQRAIVVNGSGISLDRFREASFPTGGPNFLLIARLLRDKGIMEYAEAARQIKHRFEGVSFRLVGPTDSNPAALPAGLVKTWEREGLLQYQGWVNDVRPLIADAHVYVLPSYREGTPRTVLEAMAMGRPIITTDAPGCKETVVEGLNGFKVPARNVSALTMAMERFVQDPGLISRMGRESRKLAESKYDVEKVNRVFLESMGLVEAES